MKKGIKWKLNNGKEIRKGKRLRTSYFVRKGYSETQMRFYKDMIDICKGHKLNGEMKSGYLKKEQKRIKNLLGDKYGKTK